MPVAIRAFYDCSGSSKGDRVTLAGYAATPECWREFESLWGQVLKGDGQRPSCSHLHMKNWRAGRGEFAKENGWSRENREALLRDLHNQVLSPLSRVNYEHQFLGAVCTVEIADYHRACIVIPKLKLRTPEQICLDYVLHPAIALIPNTDDALRKLGTAELYFDRGEPFFKYVDRLWRQGAPNRRPALLKFVSRLDQVEMRSSAPLQAADLLAWATNRDFTSGDRFFNIFRNLAVPALGIRLNYAKIISEYSDYIEPITQ